MISTEDTERSLRWLRRHYSELQLLLVIALAALVLLGFGINLFIYQQMRVARAQAASSRTMVHAIAAQYQMKEPAMRQFVDAMQAYAIAHPDFTPVLQRYRVALPQFFSTPVLVSTNPLPTMPRP